MRLSLTIAAILMLLTAMFLTMPSASAITYTYPGSASSSSSSSYYPYFRRAGNATSSTSSTSFTSSTSSASSSVASVPSVPFVASPSPSTTPTVSLSISPDRTEAFPGDDLRYWITASNSAHQALPSWKVAFFFNRNQMQILDAGGGRGEGDHITFTVPAMAPGDERTYSVRIHLYKKLTGGTTVTTYGSMIWDGTLGPACSHNDLMIIARPPMTGVGDGTDPVEDLARFLKPVQSSPLEKLFFWLW